MLPGQQLSHTFLEQQSFFAGIGDYSEIPTEALTYLMTTTKTVKWTMTMPTFNMVRHCLQWTILVLVTRQQ
jgi:hypothetical protein